MQTPPLVSEAVLAASATTLSQARCTGSTTLMSTKHTHPKDCPDQKDAAADRKRRADVLVERQKRQQALAHAEWLDWFPAPTGRLLKYAAT